MAQSRTTMPTRWAIASYWAQQGCFDVEMDDPHCFACGLYQPSRAPDGPLRAQWNTAGLDRAHLQDHALGGTEHVSNLVLLCRLCHKLMPRFQDRDKAIAWVNSGCPLFKIPQIAESPSAFDHHRRAEPVPDRPAAGRGRAVDRQVPRRAARRAASGQRY